MVKIIEQKKDMLGLWTDFYCFDWKIILLKEKKMFWFIKEKLWLVIRTLEDFESPFCLFDLAFTINLMLAFEVIAMTDCEYC